jgi:1-acyl-sn-glycerol-3-phosphate acyltransferase
MARVRALLRTRELVHVFPEMTRCQPGFQGTQRFTVGPFHAALQEKAWVVPIVMAGTDGVWPRGSIRLAFRSKIRVEALDPIPSSDYSSADELKAEVQRRIDQALIHL